MVARRPFTFKPMNIIDESPHRRCATSQLASTDALPLPAEGLPKSKER